MSVGSYPNPSVWEAGGAKGERSTNRMVKGPASPGANKLSPDKRETHSSNPVATSGCVIKGAGSPTAAVRLSTSFGE